MTGEVVVGVDGLTRCPWGTSTPDYQDYHDQEWGLPVEEENRIFEKLCLEGFQAGLSWLTILRKRQGFRRAFADFDPAVIAGFGPHDVDRLLHDAAIVRHRAKIEATIANARATLLLSERGLSLASLVWEQEPETSPVPETMDDLSSSTDQSKALSKLLQSHGFRFVGPTTVYAAMQALGVVNDHLAGCQFRGICEAARAEFRKPK